MPSTLQEKQGYKKTELGWIPEDWNLVSIGDVLNYEQPSKYIVSDTNYSNKNSTPVLTANKAFVLGYTNETEGIYKNTPVIIFDDFTIDNKYVDFNFKVKSSAIKILKPKNNDVNLKFIFEAMQIINFPTGGEHKRYYISEYQNSKIAIPSKKEQEKIAEILSAVDEKIEKVEKQIEQAEQLKKALMQELLTKGIGHAEFKDSTLGKIPINWDVKKFKEVSTVNQGLQIAISDRFLEPGPNRYLYITIQYLNTLKDAEYIENPQKSVICTKDDVLMTRTGNTGIVITNVEGVFHNNFFRINFDKNILQKDYLVHYLKRDKMKKLMLAYAGLTTIPDLNHGDFYAIPILVPPLSEQQKIAEILSSADEKIEILQNKKSEYEKLKKGLMQKLLTGQIRVRV